MRSTEKQDNSLNIALHRVMFDQAVSSWALGILSGFVCTAFLYGSLPDKPLLAWCFGMVLVAMLRLPLILRAATAADTDLPVKRYTAMVGLSGVSWSSLALFWSPTLDQSAQLIILLLPMVLSIGVIVSFGAWLWTYRTFVLSLQLPTLLILSLQGDSTVLRLVAPLLVFTAISLVLAYRFHLYVRETLALRMSNQNLVRDLSEQNTSLETAKNDAEAALRTKDEFLARMSHELRTPMNGVLGMSRLLHKTNLDEVQKSHVSTLQQAGEDMLSLVSDLLDASSLASGSTKLENEACDIREILEHLFIQYSKTVSTRPINIRLDIGDDIPQLIIADPQRLSQLVSKLLDNAVKFTEKGEIIIGASIHTAIASSIVEKNKPEFILSIKDTGKGIDTADLEHVRELFHQVEGSSSRRYGGSGLGLNLVQTLADLMGGRLQLFSEVGVGTEARVVLPLVEAESSRPSMTNQFSNGLCYSGSVVEGSRTTEVGPQVLVAEDNLINQLVIENVLDDLGCAVTLVENGQEALEALADRSFDMVFMDCQMPELDGYEATREARKNGLTIPIVAVTANTLAGDRTKCLNAGMDDYVTKPLTDSMLEIMLAKWIGMPRSELAC